MFLKKYQIFKLVDHFICNGDYIKYIEQKLGKFRCDFNYIGFISDFYVDVGAFEHLKCHFTFN